MDKSELLHGSSSENIDRSDLNPLNLKRNAKNEIKKNKNSCGSGVGGRVHETTQNLRGGCLPLELEGVKKYQRKIIGLNCVVFSGAFISITHHII